MARSPRHHRVITFVRSILGLLVLGASVTAAPAAGSGDSPSLTAVAARGEPSGKLIVAGEAFTPGGLVYVAVYDRLGALLEEADLIADGPAAPGRNGSVDPAAEPAEGNAFGATMGRWVTAGTTAFGANGSTDPATGYILGGTLSLAFAIPCGVTLDARAFDRDTASWSNWTNTRLGC